MRASKVLKKYSKSPGELLGVLVSLFDSCGVWSPLESIGIHLDPLVLFKSNEVARMQYNFIEVPESC